MGEVREGHRVGGGVRCGGEAGDDATQNVENQLGVGDGVADVAEGVDDLLHALAVLRDGKITLHNSMELVAEEDCTRLFVVLKQITDGDPNIVSQLIVVPG